MGNRLRMPVAAVLAFCLMGAVGCAVSSSAGAPAQGTGAPSGDIGVYSREEGSGTRAAFTELFEITAGGADATVQTASITNSTAVMMASISNDAGGIGYLSLGSLNDTVKALSIDGVAAMPENVANGSYKIARPFNAVVAGTLSAPAQDFLDFILSTDGQAVVEESGYVSVGGSGKAYTASGVSGKVVVAGSSSVSPVMEKLSEAYQQVNPGVSIEVQTSDSTTGVNMAVQGTCDFGMSSRDLKDSEMLAGATTIPLARDGIAVIVNRSASLDGLTAEQVRAIFSGEVSTWEDALA